MLKWSGEIKPHLNNVDKAQVADLLGDAEIQTPPNNGCASFLSLIQYKIVAIL